VPGRISVEDLRPAGGRGRGTERAARGTVRGARLFSGESRLEPRDAGGIIDLALEGLLARLGPCLALALGVWLPFGQIREVLGLAGLDEATGQALSIGWSLASLVPHGFTLSVVASLVGDALAGSDATVAQGVLRGLRRAPGAIVILCLTQLVTMPLVVLCLAPYFLVQWLTWCAVPIFVLEEERLLTAAERARARANPLVLLASAPRRVGRAIARSLRLSTGWPALGRWILLVVVGQVLFASVLELGAQALNYPEARDYLQSALGLGGVAAELALAAAAGLFTALAACVRAALVLAYYLDLRVRREGLDLALELRRRERAVPAAEAR
jgi:hypothetical protein